MSALPGSVGFLPLQEYFGLLVSTFVYRNNKRHLRMKEHSRIEREKEREDKKRAEEWERGKDSDVGW